MVSQYQSASEHASILLYFKKPFSFLSSTAVFRNWRHRQQTNAFRPWCLKRPTHSSHSVTAPQFCVLIHLITQTLTIHILMFQSNSFPQCIKVRMEGNLSDSLLTVCKTYVTHHLFFFSGRIKSIWSQIHSISCPNMLGSLQYQPQSLCMLVFQHQAFQIEGTIGPLSELG